MQNGARELQERIDQYGIYCLSEAPDNILMWSHYASQHQGFCIEFERREDNLLGTYELARPVQYGEHPYLKPGDFWNPHLCGPQQAVLPDDDPYMQLLFSKASDWAYEKEWRLLSKPGNCLHESPVEIKSIILGMLMPEKDEKALRDAVGGNVKFKRAVRKPYTFSLEIIEGD